MVEIVLAAKNRSSVHRRALDRQPSGGIKGPVAKRTPTTGAPHGVRSAHSEERNESREFSDRGLSELRTPLPPEKESNRSDF
jgi:hypothetical protein